MKDELNFRITEQMRTLISRFEDGNITLKSLVDGLEGAVKAMEPPLSPEVSNQFTDPLLDLDVIIATNEEAISIAEIANAVGKIKALLPSFYRS